MAPSRYKSDNMKYKWLRFKLRLGNQGRRPCRQFPLNEIVAQLPATREQVRFIVNAPLYLRVL